MTPYMASVGHDVYDKNNISLYDNLNQYLEMYHKYLFPVRLILY